ncbi:MAG: 16S rRNA (guanine(966)-N(2))-methyltransferase RsmD [Desulfomonile tiedjei]|uniref:16S rRNA (Guanine(966)-N(2))-methyltransferase RsmD n=1 Tax=Desulfomonile tiedjei TaxID=2358 RepID=A0A9D6Z1Q7_9BACT|nr:16S rRNA (guanine(966)-N(2))-methyltransferase RsmD [Desulfomonile tiedjei]
MRIIAGRFKGVRLVSPRHKGVRPTADRVREALFSTLGQAVIGSRILDLFAGTGALGFEALSRGAQFAAFSDDDRQAVELLRRNAELLGIAEQVKILSLNALTALKKLAERHEKFGIVFVDPPYGSDWIGKVTFDPNLPTVIEPAGLLVIETDSGNAPQAPPQFQKVFSRKYGGTLVEIFHFGPAST